MKTILITGGAGFIGSHTCLVLLQNGYNLIVLDSLINSSEESLSRVKKIIQDKDIEEKIEFIKGDIRDKFLLNKIFKEASNKLRPIEAVIHFAGLKAVAESIENPLLYWDINVAGSICLFNTMNENNCKTIVFSSSATIYASLENIALTEDSPISPSNPYGETKASIERILQGLYKSSSEGWRIINLRYFNPVGAHPSGVIGENPSGLPNNLFPYITQVAFGEIDRLNVFGSDWPTKDGTGVRDYIHVMDLAEAHYAALKMLFTYNQKFLNLNIGTGKGTSVLELVRTFEKINNCEIPYRYTDRRNGDLASVVADNKLALSFLEWQPKRSIEDMCRDGWNWQKNNPKGFN
tara:strand:+ start:2969 stop:4018 length:1050 start_codon:yes stop_codon:yes gene_type:complete